MDLVSACYLDHWMTWLKKLFRTSFRDALSDLALHFLNKMKIMVVKEIEREDIEFICKVKQNNVRLAFTL